MDDTHDTKIEIERRPVVEKAVRGSGQGAGEIERKRFHRRTLIAEQVGFLKFHLLF